MSPLALIGAALAIAGSFLPWVTTLGASLSAWQLPLARLVSTNFSGPTIGPLLLVTVLVLLPLAVGRPLPLAARVVIAAVVTNAAGMALVLGIRSSPAVTPGIGAVLAFVGGMLIAFGSPDVQLIPPVSGRRLREGGQSCIAPLLILAVLLCGPGVAAAIGPSVVTPREVDEAHTIAVSLGMGPLPELDALLPEPGAAATPPPAQQTPPPTEQTPPPTEQTPPPAQQTPPPTAAPTPPPCSESMTSTITVIDNSGSHTLSGGPPWSYSETDQGVVHATINQFTACHGDHLVFTIRDQYGDLSCDPQMQPPISVAITPNQPKGTVINISVTATFGSGC